ncbi:MAG: hypothetical protein ACO1N9_12115 [Flavobacterium sp.]
MKAYANIKGDSGVTAYEIKPDAILVEFGHDTLYKYSYKSAGKAVVDKMKLLAAKGRGLSTYISQKVKDKYELKLK